MDYLDEEMSRYVGEVQRRLEGMKEDGELEQLDEDGREDLALFVENSLKEIKGSLPRVVRDPTGSRAVELLIEVATPEQLSSTCRSILEGDSRRVLEIMKHPAGSFVMEKLVKKLVSENSEDLQQFVEVAEVLGGRDLMDLLSDSRGSFVLRVLIAAWAGLTVDEVVPPLENGYQKLVVDQNRIHEKAIKSTAEKVNSNGAKLGKAIELPQVAATLSVLVGCCGRFDAGLVDSLAEVIIGRDLDFLEQHATSRSGSHLVEAIVYFGSDDLIGRIYSSQLRGKLKDVAEHGIANFMLQRFLARAGATSSGIVMGVLQEVAEDFESLLRYRPGVVLALARACAQADDQDCRVQFLKQMRDATKESGSILGAVASFQKGPVGSLIIQAMLSFGGKHAVVDVGGLPAEEVIRLSKDPSWSRVVESYLRSDVNEKDKQKLIKKLRGSLVEVSCEPGGSRVVEAAYVYAGSSDRRRGIVQELADAEPKLREDPNGQFVLKTCRVDVYLSRRENWEQMENQKEGRKRLFNDILEDDGPVPEKPKPEKKKKKKATPQHSAAGGKHAGQLQSVMETLGFGGKETQLEKISQPEVQQGPELGAANGNVDNVLAAIEVATGGLGAADSSSGTGKKKKKKKKKEKKEKTEA
eukprot:CAMPEP_0113957504 /NCGR_PEP_ID=MMETSP0011_2-20120614/2818_1 /TAXON_ID=101924 /ORGANISM="Rhodosorus marinus" /LENGTH=638 /DNA_ID=CAMNT_0000968097 /DNA_START=398 /DNA_END=2314 /DNA_ORIENTATION=+ /assembly_acc=CAM_ASM_000156